MTLNERERHAGRGTWLDDDQGARLLKDALQADSHGCGEPPNPGLHEHMAWAIQSLMFHLCHDLASQQRVAVKHVPHDQIARVGAGVRYQYAFTARSRLGRFEDRVIVGPKNPLNLCARRFDSGGACLACPSRQVNRSRCPSVTCRDSDGETVIAIAGAK